MTTPNDANGEPLLDLVPFEALDAKGFEAHEGKVFQIRFADATLEVVLREVRALKGDTHRDDRAPFSLLFRGPSDAALEQATYRFEREGWGGMDLFLVCLGPDQNDDERRMLYEVVFS